MMKIEMGRKNDILKALKYSIIKSIYKYCNEVYYDQDYIVFNLELKNDGLTVAYANFDISVDITEKGTVATDDYPATPDIVEFRLNASYIITLYSNSGNELRNIKDALNDILSEQDGVILKV